MTTEEKFYAAVEIINSLPQNGTFQPSDDLMLKLEAYYKQATEGPCSVPKPSIWDMSSRTKWYVWRDLRDMSKEVAMEKYIEELTKVIETMSYNEKVSKFMSLIGPFYEVVSADEAEAQERKKKNHIKGADYFFQKTMLETIHGCKETVQKSSEKIVHPQSDDGKEKGQHVRNINHISQRHSCSEYAQPNYSSSSERQAVNVFKTKNNFRSPPFLSQKDILVLSVINLQTSLEEIAKRLEKLQALARNSNLRFCENENNGSASDEYNLNFTGTAFALLWPLAVHLYMGNF